MPTYEITAPDGKTYEVTAPEGASQSQVLEYAKKNLAAPAQAPVAAQSQPSGSALPGPLRYVHELGNQAVMGMIPGAPEAVSAMTGAAEYGAGKVREALGGRPGPSFNEAYSSALDQKRAGSDSFRGENPVASFGAGLAGGIASPVFNRLARALGGVVGPGQTTLGKMGRGAFVGAPLGAVGGFAEGRDGFEDRLESGAKGGLIAGSLGFVAPAVVSGVGGAINKARDYLGSRSGAPTAAARKVAEALQDDDMVPDQIKARLGKLGAGATIADAGGPNVRGLAEQAANQPGQARRMAERVLTPRTASMGDRIYESAKSNLGASGDFFGTLDSLSRTQRATAAPLYDEAWRAGEGRWSQRAQDLIDDPTVKSGAMKGIEILRLEALRDGVPFDPKQYGIVGFAGDGPVVADTPNIRILDAAKRGLDEIINEARDGMTGKVQWTQRLRAIDDVRKEVLKQLDHLTEGRHAVARSAWSGPAQSMDAMWRGRRFANGDEEITARALRDMSPSERDFFREGALKHIENMIDGAPDGADKARRLIAVPKMRDALREIFPDTASWNKFKMTLLSETMKARTKNEVLGNSRTALRQAGQDQSNIDVGGPLTELAQGHVIGAARSLLGNVARSAGKMPPAERNRLAEMLLSQDPSAQSDALRLIQSRARPLHLQMTRNPEPMGLLGGAASTGLLGY